MSQQHLPPLSHLSEESRVERFQQCMEAGWQRMRALGGKADPEYWEQWRAARKVKQAIVSDRCKALLNRGQKP